MNKRLKKKKGLLGNRYCGKCKYKEICGQIWYVNIPRCRLCGDVLKDDCSNCRAIKFGKKLCHWKPIKGGK